MDTVIQGRKLFKRYGNLVAVAGIDFSVGRGECFGFLGPNGAGKTSVIKMISCVSPVSEGELSVEGRDVRKEPRAVKTILGVVPQEETLDPDLTVQQNLIAYARYFNIPRPLAMERIKEALELFQLLDRRDSSIDTLSGGMKRRLLIARALLNQPNVLILDEPTTGLDPQARRLVWDRLHSLKGQGITMVLSTHYMEEAYYLCDRLVIMDLGRILVEGRPRDLVEQHVGREVIELRPDHQARDRLLTLLREKGLPTEEAGDTIYVFTQDGSILREELQVEGLPMIYRNATLEDVFLRLTGRGSREEER